MVDLATLALAVDSRDVDTGVAKLDQLTAAGSKAEAAVDRLGDSTAQTGGQIKTASQHAAEFAANAQRQASAATAAATGVGRAGSASALSANQIQNLSFQFNDLFVGLASGQKPMTVFMQQGAQIGQIAQQAGLGIGGMARAIVGLAGAAALAVATNPLLLGLAAAATAAYGAFRLFQSEVARSGELDKYVASLGLTKKEMKEIEGVGITANDVFVGLYRTLDDYLGLNDTFATVKDFISEAFVTILSIGKHAAASIYAAFVGSFKAIGSLWSNLPSLVGDAAIGAANLAIGAMETLINTAIRGINALVAKAGPILKLADMAGLETTLGEVSFGRIANQYAGTGARLGEEMGAGFNAAYVDAVSGMESFGDAWGKNTTQAAKDRLKGQADELISDRPDTATRAAREKAKALSEQEKAYLAALKAARAYNASLTEETARIGKTAIEIKRMDVASAAAAAQKAAALAPTVAGTEALRAEAFAILAAGMAWEEATRQQAASDFIKNSVEPLELQVALLGQSAQAQALATLEAEKAQKVLEVGAEAWERYHAAQTALIEVNLGQPELLETLRLITDQAYLAGDALANAFGRAGGVIGDLIGNLANYQEARQSLAMDVLAGTKTQQQADQTLANLNVRNTAQMLSGAKSLFKEKSVGYKVMSAAEKAYAMLQLFNSIRAITMDATQTASSVANSATRGAADQAAGASKIFSQLGVWAFPVVAAMVAVLASLGLKGRGGGGGAPSIPSAEDVQGSAGTGTVLGDSTGKSESIANALEIMASNSNRDLEYSNRMLQSLRAIETNIGALAANIAQQITVNGSLFDTTGLGLGQKGSSGFLGIGASSTSRSLYDLGIQLNSASVASILANGISGSTYQIVEQVKKKSGFLGIGGGTKTTYQTTTGNIDQDIRNAIVDVVGSLRQGLIDGADIIGLSGAQAILDAFQVNIGKVSFAGLTGKEIEEQLNAIFSSVGDQMAGALLPSLSELQLVGEGLFETFARVAREYQVVDIALASIGKTFGMVGVASIAARDNLVQLFGGLDEFTNQTQFFADSFLTDAEKVAPVANALRAELSRLGLVGVDTRDEFKALVLGLDLTTTAGREMYAALLAVAPAFDKVASYTEKLNKATADGLQKTIDQFGKFVESLTKYREQLMQGELRSGSAYARARAQFLATASLAASGDAGGLGSLEGVSKTFLTESRNNASSLVQYQRDVAAVVNAVDKGIFAATETVDYAQLQLEALNNSISLLTAIEANTQAMVLPSTQQPLPVAVADGGPLIVPIVSAELTEEMRQLRLTQEVQAAALAQNNATMLRYFARWEGDGLLVKTDADTPLNVVTP